MKKQTKQNLFLYIAYGWGVYCSFWDPGWRLGLGVMIVIICWGILFIADDGRRGL